jgi:mannose-6-phosphate isomerase-like protein (cupin superfamily)
MIRRLADCKEFLAGDHTNLRELLHPARAPVQIGYSLAHGTLEPGATSKRHRLAATEVYYFMSGEGVFHAGKQASTVQAGTAVYVPSGVVQWVENTGGDRLEFLCLVEPAWTAEGEEVFD